MAHRRLTTNRRTLLSELVDIIQSFLPLTANSPYATTFYSIFQESNVENYLGSSKRTKKQRLEKGFKKVYQQHRNLPYTIIRKVVDHGQSYRRHKRNPITQDEINELIDCLNKLGINLESELSAIEIDESLPKLKIPPKELANRLENHPLVNEIGSDPLEQYKNGHFNESVRKACERFEKKVQDVSGDKSAGTSLMGKVFNKDNPLIKINDLKTINDENEQDGYQKLAIGLMSAIRNIFSHGDEDQRKAEEAYEMLIFINWMFRKLNSNTD